MADAVYNRWRYRLLNGDFDPSTATIRAIFLSSGYTFDTDHDYVTDLGANEISGAPRHSVTGAVATLDDANDRAAFALDDMLVSIPTGATDVDAFVLYEFVTADGDSPLIAFYDSFTAYTPDSAYRVFSWDATGAVHLD